MTAVDPRVLEMQKLRFEKNWTLQDIATRFDISRERVRQIIGNTGTTGARNQKMVKKQKKILSLANRPDLSNQQIAEATGASVESVVAYRSRRNIKIRHKINGGSAERGAVMEEWVSKLMTGLGIGNKLMPHIHPYDIELSNGLRVDVKSCRPLKASIDTPLYSFNVRSRHHRHNKQTDMFVLVAENEAGKREVFIVPKESLHSSNTPIRFCWPPSKRVSKWHQYHNRFDLLK